VDTVAAMDMLQWYEVAAEACDPSTRHGCYKRLAALLREATTLS
jgi:hypothetical protein